jgi:hypothetical protein
VEEDLIDITNDAKQNVKLAMKQHQRTPQGIHAFHLAILESSTFTFFDKFLGYKMIDDFLVII